LFNIISKPPAGNNFTVLERDFPRISALSPVKNADWIVPCQHIEETDLKTEMSFQRP
jgi:hypothetical protein